MNYLLINAESGVEDAQIPKQFLVMEQQPFEAAIADLERTKGPAEDVLAKAANILGINLQENIDVSSTEVRFKSPSQSPGFKEQWLLRWLLKNLNASGSKDRTSEPVENSHERYKLMLSLSRSISSDAHSFVLLPQFWSLLLSLTSRIADEICLEILLERRFFHTLDESLRLCLAARKSEAVSHHPPRSDVDLKERPTKRRRLSRPQTNGQTEQTHHNQLIWISLQAACRCVDLLGSPSTRTPKKIAPTWSAPWNEQASLFGGLLQAVAFLLSSTSGTGEQLLLSQILSTVCPFWKGATATRAQNDDPNRAFASHCLKPSLRLLGLFQTSNVSVRSFASSRNTLERLIAIHIVFPFRATFNERYAKKWRNVHDVLLYDHLENMLKGFKERVLVVEDSEAQPNDSLASHDYRDLSWIILDVAGRSIPSSDIRKRQQEQPWIEALFTSLVHVLWPNIPQVTATGVVQQEISTSALGDRDGWIAPLERLVDVALALKLKVTLPVLGYTLSAILALEEETYPWPLMAKLICLDVNILIPNTGLSNSERLLKQVLEKLESTTVSTELYGLIRDEIVLPVMRAFARARYLHGFVAIWQQNLAEAIRVRYTSKDEPNTIPAVLVWDDEDVFDEFKSLALVHAPPSMGQRLFDDLLEQLKTVAEKVGSTADLFAKLAIFSALLELSESQDSVLTLDTTRLSALFDATMNVLPRKSDYQAQRWRLWRLLRLLVPRLVLDNFRSVEQLFQPDFNFMPLDELKSSGLPDETRKKAAKFIECLECFTLVVELAVKVPRLRTHLPSEINHLTELMLRVFQAQPKSSDLWNGRSFDCDDQHKLVSACIGRLLQKPEVLSSCSEALKPLIDRASDVVTKFPLSTKQSKEVGPNLGVLLTYLLKAEEVTTNTTLRQTVLQHVTAILDSTAEDSYQTLLQVLPLEAVKKSHLKIITASAVQRLKDHAANSTLEAIAQDLNLLIRVESVAGKTSIDSKDWSSWVGISETLLQRKDVAASSTTWPTIRLLNQILDKIWTQATASQQSSVLSDIISWIRKTIEASPDAGSQQPVFLALQNFFGHACRAEGGLDNIIPSHKMAKLQKKFVRLLQSRLDRFLHGPRDKNAIFELKLTLYAAYFVGALDKDEQIRQAIPTVQKMLQSLVEKDAEKEEWRLRLSTHWQCLKVLPPSEVKSEEKEVEDAIQEVASSFETKAEWTNADLSLLIANAGIFVRQVGATNWPRILEFLQAQSKQAGFQLVRPAINAAVISQITTQDILQTPQLAELLGDIACVQSLDGGLTLEELFLNLENARTVLESHPLVVNQATLDRLLASICAIASSASDEYLLMSSLDTDAGPQPSDIHDRLCAVIGAVLTRHRRRVSDRYHLLLPALQTLLRCLFWPGSRSLHDGNRTTVAVTLNSFGKTLPRWMRESSEALPPSSAEKFSRLLSSICNPTVSAARSSKKRGHNELNDETKRARLLAGQHMQYLVMAYARCTLDGQIPPSVKERLMPGLYSVMGSMERDLLRALNAGMDPSSRAIFKTLYDDWTRYGKWNKS